MGSMWDLLTASWWVQKSGRDLCGVLRALWGEFQQQKKVNVKFELF